MEKIGIFYGPEKGSVGKVANLIAEQFANREIDLVSAKSATISDINKYNKIICGISTIGRNSWDSDYADNDWDLFFTQISKANWVGKKVAIYGLGDQINYPDHFVDAIGWVHEKLVDNQAKVVGYCKTGEYQFNNSEGIKDDQFLGLPIDEDNEPEKTPERIKNWISQLKNEGF